MPEQIYTFTDEEVARMFKSGEMKVLTSPEPAKPKSDHELSLEKSKRLFGEGFKDVYTLRIGGKIKEELKQDLKGAGIYPDSPAEDIINNPNFTVFSKPGNIEIIYVTVLGLGFKDGAVLDQVYERAHELGLKLCPREAGIYLMLKDINQPLEKWYALAMEPVYDSDCFPWVFLLYHIKTKKFLGFLSSDPATNDCIYDPKDLFAFRI